MPTPDTLDAEADTVPLLSTREVAKRLNVSKTTVYALISNQRLRAVNISAGERRVYRVPEDALLNFIHSGSTHDGP